jgi:hypothetical protein
MYDRTLHFPAKLESLLLEYWQGMGDPALMEAATLVAKNFYFDPGRHILFVSILFERNVISIDDAVPLLVMQGRNLEDFPESIRHVIDVVWLVNQDVKDDVMSPRQDSLLGEALRNLARNSFNEEVRS